MKLIALFGAGALAAGTMVAAAPADAQRYGYGHDYGRHDGRDHYRPGYREFERYGYGHGGGYGHRGGHRGGYGFHRGYGYGHGRLVCRIHRGYYGPVRRCFRIYR